MGAGGWVNKVDIPFVVNGRPKRVGKPLSAHQRGRDVPNSRVCMSFLHTNVDRGQKKGKGVVG
jgi:hypothetical protein